MRSIIGLSATTEPRDHEPKRYDAKEPEMPAPAQAEAPPPTELAAAAADMPAVELPPDQQARRTVSEITTEAPTEALAPGRPAADATRPTVSGHLRYGNYVISMQTDGLQIQQTSDARTADTKRLSETTAHVLEDASGRRLTVLLIPDLEGAEKPAIPDAQSEGV